MEDAFVVLCLFEAIPHVWLEESRVLICWKEHVTLKLQGHPGPAAFRLKGLVRAIRHPAPARADSHG